MAMARSSIRGRTPTGRNVNSYLGKVPAATGTGPKVGIPSTPAQATRKTSPRVRPSRAQTPRVRPALANSGYGPPPRGAGGGVPKSTTPMAGRFRRTINKPKTGRPGRGLGKPRADFPSKI